MVKTWVIAKKDIRDTLQGKFYLNLILVSLICLPYFDGIKSTLADLNRQAASSADLSLASQLFVDSYLYTLPFILSIFVCSIASGYSIVVDKAKRTLEPLMATPLNIHQIWIGKSLATALVGIVTGTLVSLVALILISLTVIKPGAGIVYPGVLPLISAFVVSPLLVLAVVFFISFLQLTIAKPVIASLGFSAIFIGIYFPTIIAQRSASWGFPLIYLLMATLLVAVSLVLSRSLTKERVALSSKS
jgi:ABC-type Na+ efflux pump permease subunit